MTTAIDAEAHHRRLGDLFQFKNGRGFKKTEWTTRGLPIIRIQNLNNAEASFNYFAGEYDDNILVERGDLLFSWSGTVGSSFGSHIWQGEKGLLNQHIFKIGHDDTIDRTYAFYALRHITIEIEKAVSGAVGLVHITKERLNEFTIPCPSLSEQHRIVALLDQAFDAIATAKANTEKNLQNAHALFQSRLGSVFAQRGTNWRDLPFDDLVESNVIGLTKNSKEQGQDKKFKYVKMNNITRDNRFDFSKYTAVDATVEETGKFGLKNGDFLFNTRNSVELVGKACIYDGNDEEIVLFNNNIMRVRFQNEIDPQFVLLAFSSKRVMEDLAAMKSGTTNVAAIYYGDLKSLRVPIAPISVQRTISADLENLLSETQRLASLYQKKLAALDALKKSLLHQAFSGQL